MFIYNDHAGQLYCITRCFYLLIGEGRSDHNGMNSPIGFSDSKVIGGYLRDIG